MKQFFPTLKMKLSNLFGHRVVVNTQLNRESDFCCDSVYEEDDEDCIPCAPVRLTSGTAQTLESLLMGKRIHCMSASKGASSNRLKDHIASLRKTYFWKDIKSGYTTVVTKDGRHQRVMEYWLPASVIADAKAEGFLEWCKAVRAACRERKRLLQLEKASACSKKSMPSDIDQAGHSSSQELMASVA